MIPNDFRLETARLVLRPFTEADGEAMLRIQSQPAMVRYTPDPAWQGIDDARRFVGFVQWLYRDVPDRGWFRHYFAVIEKASGELIGYCGIGGPEFDRTLTEILYGIDSPHWGKGYATEVARALLRYGFEDLHLPRIVAFAEERNVASLRVLEKAGLRRIGRLSGLPQEFQYFDGEPLYELRLEDWT